MKAIMQRRYGAPEDVLQLEEVERPVIGADEVLVRVCATALNVDMWHSVTGKPFITRAWCGLRKPRGLIPGLDLAGVVEAVGNAVTQLRAGDRVFGESLRGTPAGNGGTLAEYCSVPQDNLALIPEGISFEQAAAVPNSGSIALQVRVAGEFRSGRRVLINGAAGSVGSLALQLCKAFGAHVTAVDKGSNLSMLRTLGADEVIDYTLKPLTERDERYEFIFDVASTLTIPEWKKLLTPDGFYWCLGHDHYSDARVIFGPATSYLIKILLRAKFDKQLPKLKFSNMPTRQENMQVLRQLLADGKLTPIVDKVFPLHEAAAALRYLASGNNCGRVIIAP